MTRALFVLAVFPFFLTAQERDSLLSDAFVTVLSEPSKADVLIDSAFVGTTPLHRVPVTPGIHRLLVAYPSIRDWNVSAHEETLHLARGEERTLSIELGTVLNLHTIPSGAAVYSEGKFLGLTPLYYQSRSAVRGALLLKKEGFEDRTLEAAEVGLVSLSMTNPIAAAKTEIVAESFNDRKERHWATYASAAGIVVSGVAAAYFKHQANSRFDLYAAAGDPAELDATRRYDGYSAAAFVLTQVSFALLTYFLLSE